MKRLNLYSSMLLSMVAILLAVAMVTLLERKLLSLTQGRLGPNKVSINGLLQPVLDGFKLLFKPLLRLEQHYYSVYCLVSLLSLSLMFMLYLTIPFPYSSNSEYQMLWVLVILGLMSHLILMSGWSSYSKYSMLGSIRSLAQSISYEIVLSLMLMMPFLLNHTLSWNMSSMSVMLIFIVWNIILLMESHRAPFDLSESESELVSGFNTEYTGLMFVYFFLAEYGNLMALALLSTMLWCGLSVLVLLWVSFWLMIRTCFVRMRFDMLMSFTWLNLLPMMIWVWLLMVNSSLL